MLVPILTVLPLLRGTARPAVEGDHPETVRASPFRIHFVRAGADAPPDTDADGNGLPDTVDAVRDGLLTARETYETQGWRALVPDDGEGGDDGIDVYLRRLEVYGYATPVPVPDGSSSCYLQLDPANSVEGGVMASVATHELHHCVQFRYTANEVSWLYESTATYQQYALVEGEVLDYAAGLLWLEWLTGTDRPLSATDGRHEYAAFVFSKFWVERGGADPTRLLRFWDQLSAPSDATVPDWIGTLDRAARHEWGEPLDAVFLEHAAWNAFACAADDGAHYDPDVIPCIVDARVPSAPFVDGERVTTAVGPYTAAYRDLVPGTTDGVSEGPLRLECRGKGSTRLVARDADGAEVAHVDGDDVQVTVPPGGDALLVLAGMGDHPLSRSCELAPPRAPLPAPSGAVGCATAPTGGSGALALVLLLSAGRRRRSTIG